MSEVKFSSGRSLAPTEDPRWTLALRITESRHFARAEQLKKLLLYVTDRALRGAVTEITEHEIAVRVFARRADFNRSEDSIVRVQMRHLRHRLDAYFLDEGKKEAIQIHIRTGSYVSLFESPPLNRAGKAECQTVSPSETSAERKIKPWPWLAKVGLICLALTNAILLVFILSPATPSKAPKAGDFWARIFDPKHHTQIVVGDALAHD
jgi:hypothetical protein